MTQPAVRHLFAFLGAAVWWVGIGSAGAQQWVPAGMAPVDQGAARPAAGSGRWVQPAAAYQPPGRVYAVDNRIVNPLRTAQGVGGVAVQAAPPGLAGGMTAAPSFPRGNVDAPPPGTGLGPITVALARVVPGGLVHPPAYGGYGAFGHAGCVPLGGVTDPYAACGPLTLAPAAPLTAGLRRPFAELEGRIGDQPETLQGNLFVPFLQRQESFWFADIRGQFDDTDAAEGNWGVAYRWLRGRTIYTVYGFYDLRHTQFENNFHGATVGAEVLTLEWEGRFNWYQPEGGSRAVPGATQAAIQNNAIVVQSGVEAAYYGFDAEIGRLLWRGGGLYDAEVRAFVGGYFFDTSVTGFDSFGGPRLRVEGRLHDLPRLGPGSSSFIP